MLSRRILCGRVRSQSAMSGRTLSRHILCSMVLALAGLVYSAPAALGQDVQWRYDYNNARKEASTKKLPLLLDFGTQSCIWCKRLDETTFRDAKISGALNEKFIPVKIDGERDSYLTQALRVERYPTLVFASADGKILDTIEGYKTALEFNERVQRVLSLVGEPEWMLRDVQLAEKAIKSKEYARAIALLKTITEDGSNRPVQGSAQKMLEELEVQAQDRLTKLKDQVEKGQTPEAIEQLTELLRTMPGLNATKDAGEMLTKLAQSPEMRRQQRAKRAQELLAQAQDFYKFKDYLPCLDRCEILMASYGDLAEGIEASQISSTIKSDPEWVQNACDVLGDRLGSLYLSLADSLLKKGDPQRAKFYLERVVRAFPGSRQAESAQIRLAQLGGMPPTTVVVPPQPPATPGSDVATRPGAQ